MRNSEQFKYYGRNDFRIIIAVEYSDEQTLLCVIYVNWNVRHSVKANENKKAGTNHGRRKGAGGSGALPTWILKISAKKVVFLVSSGKKQIWPLLAPLGNF